LYICSVIKLVHISFVIILLCLFVPSSTYACGSKSQKCCCCKKTLSKTEKKDCCKSNNSQEKDNDCEGNCGHTNCTTSTVHFNLLSFEIIDFKPITFDFSAEKSKFYHVETLFSSDFTSVWLPPKIK
jgi:hypothetical protein